jgi:hypothetical protein
VTTEALDYVRRLFVEPDATGLELVAEAVIGLDDPAAVRAALRALVNELLAR